MTDAEKKDALHETEKRLWDAYEQTEHAFSAINKVYAAKDNDDETDRACHQLFEAIYSARCGLIALAKHARSAHQKLTAEN